MNYVKRLEVRITVQIVMILGFAACTNSYIIPTDFTNTETVDFPEIGVFVSTGLGERLAAKGIRTTGSALFVMEEVSFNKKGGKISRGMCALSVMPVSVFKTSVYQTKSIKAECFGPVTYQYIQSDGSTNWNCRGFSVGNICHDMEEGSFFLEVSGWRFALEQDHDHIRIDNKINERRSNFVQEFLYYGRVGNELKFVYREFSNSLLKPAFTQEVRYDFSKSKIISFKDLRLEIFKADNNEVTYKLIRNF